MQVSTLDRPKYHSYLLRLWCDNTPSTWRAALHCTSTEHVYHFVTVQAMIAFLTAQLSSDEDACTDEHVQRSADDPRHLNEQASSAAAHAPATGASKEQHDGIGPT